MRIAQVSQYFYPFMIGGVEWYVLNISRELSRRGNDVDVITLDRCNGERAPEEEEFEGFRIKRLRPRIDLSYRLKVWKGLERCLDEGKYDLIHTYDYACHHSRVAVRFSRRRGIPSVVTVFDAHSMIPRNTLKRKGMKVIEWYYRKTLLECDVVLVRAPQLVEYIAAAGVGREKIFVTPSGVRDDCFQEFDGSGFKKRYSVEGMKVVLYVGRLNRLKGPHLLLKAAERVSKGCKDVAFVIVGGDQGKFGKELREYTISRGMKNVVFTGQITDFKEKMAAYSACDVFVMPSGYEGTSQALFEAMAQSKPVVAFNVGGIPYQFEDSVSGFLVPYGDVDMLAERIELLLRDDDLARRMGENARNRASMFRYSKLASELVEIYSSACVKNGYE